MRVRSHLNIDHLETAREAMAAASDALSTKALALHVSFPFPRGR